MLIKGKKKTLIKGKTTRPEGAMRSWDKIRDTGIKS